MAELAAGAVNSLLGVISSEARLLRGVQGDVQFIREEMESMNSFLTHLFQSAPPGSEHNEQVRTWMNQVRLLAQDCNNCIAQYRVGGDFRRHLRWVPRFLHKLVAQHRAAVRLRELRDRARDVGERRIRYGVELPPAAMLTPVASLSAVAGGYAAEDDEEEEDGDDGQLTMGATTDRSAQRALFSRTMEDYIKTKIFEWLYALPPNAGETMSFAIVDPDRDLDALRLAKTMVFGPDFEHGNGGYHCAILVDIPVLHPDILPLRPKEVLYYILRQLKLEQLESQSREQGTDQGEEEEDQDSWQVYFRKFHIYHEKEGVLNRIKENIKRMKVYEKLDKIKSDIQTQPPKGQQKKNAMDQQGPDVHELLRQLLLTFAAASQQDMPKLSASDIVITEIAEKLKEHMEEDEQGGGGGEGGVGRGVEEDRGGGDIVEELGGRGGEGRAGRRVQNKDVQEEDCEGDGKETVEEKCGGKEGGDGGGGDIAQERGGGRGEILEEDEGGDWGEIFEEEHRGGDEEEEDDDDSYEDDDSQDEEQQIAPIYLHKDQYVHILRQVFPKIITSNKSATKQATDTILGEDQIKQMIDEPKEEIVLKPEEGKQDKIREAAQKTKATFNEIVDQKMDKIKHEFKEQLKIKGLVDDIKDQLQDKCPLFILKIDETVDLPRWDDTRNALSLLGCSADVLIVTTSMDIQQAKQYCYPQTEPIDYSLVGLYYDIVLKVTREQKYEKNYNPQIFRNILEQCERYDFCMKIFAHALYVNPKRSNKDLNKLYRILQASTKSSKVIAKKMFEFSYTDMPKEYKSCLLYLTIFPPGYRIRRSTLVGQWVADGLISKEDWSSSVHWANRCFDELINRCLADPADTAAGKVKSCVVGDLVHGFITKIARKQYRVETPLPHHLAPFSIFNALQLRSSFRAHGFFRSLSKSSQVSLLTVLDLEGCRCFGGKNQRYLKDICSKMLLLKYLSLRGTDATQLPSKINNLHELEVLDIRQTNVPMNATAKVLLLKLKRLLVGHIDLNNATNFGSSGRIPHRIGQMVNMEVLSNVKAQQSHDLKDIGKLRQLRKLGVVIDDKDSHLRNLFETISDLHECLHSLSITTNPVATPTPREAGAGTPSNADALPDGIGSLFKDYPKILQSLSIRGTTHKGSLLPLFMKGGSDNKLSKVTLSHTLLSQDDLKVLAKLPMLHCVRLHHIECTENMLIFKKEEFICLKYLLVEGSYLTNITFEDGSAPELEKMVLSFTSTGSISGVERLPKLEELELNNSFCGRLLSSFDNAAKIAKLTLHGTEINLEALQILTKKPNIRCLVLLDKSFGGRQNETIFTLRKDEFLWLNLLVVNCSTITKIVFTSGSAPRLEKIVWSSSTCLSGINELPRLKELDFNGAQVPDEVREAIEKHKNNPSLKHSEPEMQDKAKEDEQEDSNDAARFSLFCC